MTSYMLDGYFTKKQAERIKERLNRTTFLNLIVEIKKLERNYIVKVKTLQDVSEYDLIEVIAYTMAKSL